MDTLDRGRVLGFFRQVTSRFPVRSGLSVLVVTHLIPDRPFFIEALSDVLDVCSVFAKPKSIHPNVKNWLAHKYPIDEMSRGLLATDRQAIALIERRAGGAPLIILDIGGYFAPTINYIAKHYSGKLVGVVEDTENGHRRYLSVRNLACPIVSVARSPLKAAEDFLVGESIVFSVEALLREQGDILHGRTACVIGYGRLGSSIASLLHDRRVRTVVYDIDPTKRVIAMAHGFTSPPTLSESLHDAGLVFCATGNVALKAEDFRLLEPGAYVATVTSSDDELQFDDVKNAYRERHTADYITKYTGADHHFYLLNRGQAVNFIHGASVGPFIYLVHGEILASVARLASGKMVAGIHENDGEIHEAVAESWYQIFRRHVPIRVSS